MNKSNNGFLHRGVNDLTSKHKENVNYLQFCWKPLKSNFQKIYLLLKKYSIIFK